MNLKKLAKMDLAVINEPWTKEEKENFSKFLKQRKSQRQRTTAKNKKELPLKG